jgi:two-component system sensor histidine kinase AtoS
MFVSLRIKLWFLVLLLIGGLGLVFNELSSRLILDNSREIFDARMGGVVRGVQAYWDREHANIMRSSTLYSQSEKVIAYSVYGLHNLLRREIVRLMENSGYQAIEVRLVNGTVVSTENPEVTMGEPLLAGDPRQNLSRLVVRIRDKTLEVLAIVPITKMGAFLGQLTLVKQWSEARLQVMGRLLQCDLALSGNREILASTLGRQRVLTLWQEIARREGKRAGKQFSLPIDGEDHAIAEIDLGETVQHEGLRIYAALSKRSMLIMLKQTRSQTFQATLVALSISFLFAVIFAEKVLVSRIRRIRDGARLIAQEQLSFRLSDERRDEVGELARAFNEMAGKLEVHHQALLAKNEEMQVYIQGLENMKSYIQNVLGSLGTGVITWNQDGKSTTINPAATRLMTEMDLPATDLTLKRLIRRLSKASRSPFFQALRGLFQENREGEPFEVEYVCRTNRSGKILQTGLTYLRDSDQQPYGIVSTFEDVTQKKVIEQQLYHADKLSSIGQLAASVAHEIKNPLASIKTLGQLLQEETREDDSRREYIDVIVTEVNRLNRVVEQLLKYARPESSRFERIRLMESLQPVKALISHEMERHQVRLVLDVPEDLEVWVDPEKMKQVLLNLLFNALQAMTKGGEISIRAWADGNGPWQVIEVRDQGEGMSEETCRRIFEPFFTTKQRGTGLGLAIVKKIVDLHGGEIRATSVPGQGTVFTMLLPRK